MADDPTELTREQREQVGKWLDGKVGGGVIGKCSICAARTWVLVEHFVHAPTWGTDGGIRFGGVAFPLVMLTCRNCGNTQFISAVMMGLLGDKAPKEAENEGGTDGP